MDLTASPVPLSGQSFVGSLRDEAEDKKRLEKNNFDLKMKVYYLEESLRKAASESLSMGDPSPSMSPSNGALASSSVLAENNEADITSLRLQLEEKDIELEQRNLLLLKAKGAIEALKGDVQRLKASVADGSRYEDQESRVLKMKQAFESKESELRGQCVELESQLSAARQMLASKEQLRSTSEDKAVSAYLMALNFVSLSYLLFLYSDSAGS